MAGRRKADEAKYVRPDRSIPRPRGQPPSGKRIAHEARDKDRNEDAGRRDDAVGAPARRDALCAAPARKRPAVCGEQQPKLKLGDAGSGPDARACTTRASPERRLASHVAFFRPRHLITGCPFGVPI
jgi:hypothetical protein